MESATGTVGSNYQLAAAYRAMVDRILNHEDVFTCQNTMQTYLSTDQWSILSDLKCSSPNCQNEELVVLNLSKGLFQQIRNVRPWQATNDIGNPKNQIGICKHK